MKHFILSLLLLIGSGCGHYSRSEKLAFGALVAAHSLDGLTTDYIIGNGGRELNPLLSERPTDQEIYLFKAGVIGGFWLLGEVFPEHRERIFAAGTFAGAAPVVWNTGQIIGE